MTKQDATYQAELVRTGQVSPEELVKDSIKMIEHLNPSLNAVTSKRYDKAISEARERDFTGKPFGGVPILLKDLGQEQAGEPSSSGARLFQNYVAKSSDLYVQALEDLGFIVLGRTNTPEFGFKNISDSELNGSVNFPNDLTRNAGGSSGGAAAALASGMVQIASASDGGGSIRIPAAFNGLIGLKPSRGRIPVGPHSFRGWQGASVQFCLTKSVRDTKRLLYHLQTCQFSSPFTLPMLSRESLYQFSPKKVYKIAVATESPLGTRVSSDAVTAVNRVAHFLSQKGHDIVYLDSLPLDGEEALKSYYVMNSVETASMFSDIERGLGRSVKQDDMELMTWAIYQSGQKILAKDFSKNLQTWDKMSYKMSLFHEIYDLLLTPTTADIAPKHGTLSPNFLLKEKLKNIDQLNQKEQQELIWEMFLPSAELTPYTQQANLTGQPSISLPVYRTLSGFNLGVQMTSAKGKEDLLLYFARQLEEDYGFQY